MQLKNLSKRDRKALMIGIVASGAILVLFYVILPVMDASGAVADQLDQREQYLQRSVNAIRYQDYYEQRLSEIERVREQYDRQLLNAEDPNTASGTLSTLVRELAQLTNVDIQRTNPLPPQNVQEKYVKITVQVQLQSDIPELTDFLAALAAHDKFLLVEELQINTYRSRENIRLQPKMNISGYIRLST